MSKLTSILNEIDVEELREDKQTVEKIKALIRELVDETFDKDDAKAYEFWQKVEEI